MTGASIIANGVVTAGSGGGMIASGGSTITLNGVTLQGAGGQAMMADGSTIVANGVTINWPNGYGGSLADATNGGRIEFTAGSTIAVPTGGFSAALLLAEGPGSSIAVDGTTVSFTNNGITAVGAQNGASIVLSNSTIEAMSGAGGGTPASRRAAPAPQSPRTT